MKQDANGKSSKQKLFEEGLKKALQRLESSGISYPADYYRKLIDRYPAFKYPGIVVRMGKPNIRRHPLYRNVLERKRRLLDYGCGTGDDIRALIEDGYPKSRITAYDVNWDSINLGFDLYLDEERLQGIFVVSKEFPFGPREFDAVYSGSVLHGFEEIEEMTGYLKNALEALVEKGLLFGSTVGADEPVPKGDEGFPPTPLLERQLRQLLECSGFKDLKISRTEEESAGRPMYRFWFSGVRP